MQNVVILSHILCAHVSSKNFFWYAGPLLFRTGRHWSLEKHTYPTCYHAEFGRSRSNPAASVFPIKCFGNAPPLTYGAFLTPGETRPASMCYHAKFGCCRSSVGPTIFEDAVPRPLNMWCVWPARNTSLHHDCYHSKFGCSCSNGWFGKLWHLASLPSRSLKVIRFRQYLQNSLSLYI